MKELLIEAADYGLWLVQLENEDTWRERDLRYLSLMKVIEI